MEHASPVPPLDAVVDAVVDVVVDAVVVTYRSASSLADCLTSIDRRQASVLVVENASGDASPEIARAHGVEVVETGDNLGFARAANLGAERGTAPAILFLNPDARLEPGALDAMLRELDDPTVGIVGARLRYLDGTPQRSRWGYPAPLPYWQEALGMHPRAEPDDGFVVGACFLVRRSVFEGLGGFDERYWLYGEEADLCFRAERAGVSIRLAEGAVCGHESGGSDRGSSEFVATHFALGSERFVLLHHGRMALASYRAAGLVGSLVRRPLLRRGDPRRVVRDRQIRHTARALVRHPTTLGPVTRPDVDAGPTVVVISLEPWDEVWRRNQFLVRELLRRDPLLRVLWVDPPLDVLHELRRHGRFPGRRAQAARPVPGRPRVLRVTTRKYLPRVVWPFVDRGLVRQVRRAMEREGFEGAAVWINDNSFVGLARAATGRVVYDITDDWIDASGTAREVRRRRRLDRELRRRADEVVVCSAELARRRADEGPVTLIPNAVDADHFREPRPRPDDLPASPCAVYVGTLHEDRIDVDLVLDAAAAMPGVSFVLVGPDHLGPESQRRLQQAPNVHRLGPRPYADVPAYLQHAAVVIVPHVVTPFTESLDPIKAYECLAVARPTLATPVAGFTELPAPVLVAPASEWVAALTDLLDEPPPVPVPVADPPAVPSWAARADSFATALFGDGPARPTTRRSKVVFLGHTAKESGGEIALVRLLGGLTHTDAHVLLAEDGPIVAALQAAGAEVEVIPMAVAARQVERGAVRAGRLPVRAVVDTIGYTWTMARRLRQLRPDVVHTNTLKAALYGGLAGRLAGVPVVWHLRDRISSDYLPGSAAVVIRALARVVPAAVITNSKATDSTLGTPAGRGPRRVVIHDPLPPLTVSRRPPTTEPVVAIIGRITEWKGQDVFLRAFAAAFPDGGATALVVGAPLFGEFEFEARLHQLADELGLAGRVTFTGHRRDVDTILGQVDIVVHASVIPEPFGQVVVEAMAAGRAVVASAAGGPLEIVNDGVDGVLVPPGDVDALAAALRRLAGDADWRDRLGAAAIDRARAFDPSTVGPRVEALHRLVTRRT